MTRRGRALTDFADGFAFHQSSPLSPFARGTICTIRTTVGCDTIAGTRLVETVSGARRERELDRDALVAMLAERFSIRVGDEQAARLMAIAPSPVAAAIP